MRSPALRLLATGLLTLPLPLTLPLSTAAAALPSAQGCVAAIATSAGVICKDATLRALDRRMATTIQARTAALPPAEAQALRDDQRDWIRRRDALFADTVPSLGLNAAEVTEVMAGWLRGRIGLLERIAPRPGTDPNGYWANARAELRVTVDAGRTAKLLVTGQDPVGKRWTCLVQGRATPIPGGLSVAMADRPVRLMRDRASVRITDDGAGKRYCQPGGQLTGRYFSAATPDRPGN